MDCVHHLCYSCMSVQGSSLPGQSGSAPLPGMAVYFHWERSAHHAGIGAEIQAAWKVQDWCQEQGAAENSLMQPEWRVVSKQTEGSAGYKGNGCVVLMKRCWKYHLEHWLWHNKYVMWQKFQGPFRLGAFCCKMIESLNGLAWVGLWRSSCSNLINLPPVQVA